MSIKSESAKTDVLYLQEWKISPLQNSLPLKEHTCSTVSSSVEITSEVQILESPAPDALQCVQVPPYYAMLRLLTF
jgi:hypothetical protein